jgi:SAM-dependent methyltransferase
MVNIQSTDYHDFVFKDGRLVGEFDQMYRRSSECPWHQDVQDEWLDIRILLEMIKEHAPFDYILDLGCGLGYFLNILNKNVASNNCDMVGIDISSESCRRARQVFDKFRFYSYNLMRDRIPNNIVGPKIFTTNKLITMRGILWYVFQDLKSVVVNIKNLTESGDLLVVDQNFPPLDSQFVGKDRIPNPESIVSLFNRDFDVIRTLWLDNRMSRGNDRFFMGIFRRK